jgi:hypothetical protein
MKPQIWSEMTGERISSDIAMRPAVNDVNDEPKRCRSLNKDDVEGQSRQEYFN